MLYRGGVIKLPRVRFLPAAGAKILAMLTVNHYIYALKLMPHATHTLLITTMELAPSKLVLVETTQVPKQARYFVAYFSLLAWFARLRACESG